MAMQDYWIDCNKVEQMTIGDGTGGYEVADTIGIGFKGLATQRGSSEQLIGALRGQENVQYAFTAPANLPLKKDDKITYVEGGVRKYIRLTSDAIINTDLSQQTDWRLYNAESYTPKLVV